jgi:hypothetical protein
MAVNFPHTDRTPLKPAKRDEAVNTRNVYVALNAFGNSDADDFALIESVRHQKRAWDTALAAKIAAE